MSYMDWIGFAVYVFILVKLTLIHMAGTVSEHDTSD